MDHSSMGMGMDSMSGMMVPYLHFSGGDYLFLAAWRPTSPGEIAAASMGLLLLAMLERWLAAVRMMFDRHWHQRAMALVAASEQAPPLASPNKGKAKIRHSESESPDLGEKSPPPAPPHANGIQDNAILQPPQKPSYLRTIPPFIAAHDIPRGILFALQMFLGYLLMLAVMTFQAAYLISIVLGLGIGETLFGRVSRVSSAH